MSRAVTLVPESLVVLVRAMTVQAFVSLDEVVNITICEKGSVTQALVHGSGQNLGQHGYLRLGHMGHETM